MSTDDCCLSLRQFRLSTSRCDLVIPSVDLSEDGTCGHILIFFHVNGNDRSADSGIHRVNVTVHLCIVSRFPFGEILPGGITAANQDKNDRNEQPFGAENRRHYFPPKRNLIVFSAVPIPRASEASAMFRA